MPADAKESGSHDRSAVESGRKPPNPSSKTSTASLPCTSTPPPQSSIWRRRLPERASSTRPRCFMPRRSVSSDASRSDAPRTAGRSGTRSPACGPAATRRRPSLPQQPGWLLRCTSICRRGTATWASERMASAAFRRAASRPVSSAGRRSSTLRLSRRPAAISTPSASSQGARSRTAAVPRARTSRPVASITSTEGPWPRRNWRQARWTGSPAPPHSARPDSCRRCSRCRGVRDWAWARPGSAPARVGAGGTAPARAAAPASSHAGSIWSSLMAPPYAPPAARRESGGRNARGAGSGTSLATPKDRQPVTHLVTQAGCSPASRRSLQ